MPSPTTFLVESALSDIVIGSFVAIAFGVPGLLVLRGFLTGASCGVSRKDQPLCLLITFFFVFLAVVYASRRQYVTVDASARSVTWYKTVLGIRYSTTVWGASDLQSLEVHRYPYNRSSAHYWVTYVRGPKGSRTLLCEDFESSKSSEVRQAIRELNLPVEHTKSN